MHNLPEKIWLLGASTGGLHAVRDFLKQVSPDCGYGMVYAQHIDGQQMGTMQRMIATQTGWSARVAVTGEFIRAGEVALVPPDAETRVSKNGQWIRFSSAWPGHYSPCVDQLAKRMSLLYRENLGVIIFTGMGDDGSRGCPVVKERGGLVWVQDPGQCTSPSMPESVIASGCADFVGSVDQLAKHFNASCGDIRECS